ncbi:MAG: flagellar export chaperone FliS [Planctomycetota bacterium]|jgi:flagellar protein FliS
MKGIQAYQDTAVTTQSKGRLVVMLYEGAVKFLKLAIREIEANNPEAKGKYINKAKDIINELNAVLDMNAGGEIATNLRRLYCFMNNRLSQANVKQDPSMIREVITMLEELNQSWKAIAD